MASKRQLEKRIREVSRSIRQDLVREALKLAESGAVDVAASEEDYVLAKALLARACEKQASGFVQHPKIDAYRKALRHF